MAQWNQSDKTLLTKIVYWGPALGGKTTNLQQIHAKTDPAGENRLISLNTSSDRTLFFDLLPLDFGKIFGHTLKIQLFTVPGQVRYDATRRVVLAGADAVVFVADSQRGRGAENRAAWENLRTNLRVNGLDPQNVPVIVQCNKQDLAACLTLKEVEACLQSGRAGIAASALQGRGVMETFRTAVLEMLRRLGERSGRRRAEDVKAIEEQVARAFARYEALSSAAAAAPVTDGAGARPSPAAVSMPGGLPCTADAAGLEKLAPPASSAALGPGGALRPAGPEEGASIGLLASGLRSMASEPASAAASIGQPAAPVPSTTIHFDEGATGEELLVRSLKATLGIAEQFGELREVKNRLARRVGELEGLQTLARDLAARHDAESVIHGLADAALSIPGARAASVLLKDRPGEPLREAIVRGTWRDPLLGSGGPEAAVEEILRQDEPVQFEELPVLGGVAEVEAGSVRAAISVPLSPVSAAGGLVLVYSDQSFEAEDLRFLGLLASHAAVSLDNAAMTERLTRYNDQLEKEVKARTAQLERANIELRELDRMKDRFLSSVSHEMRTPLTGILSGIELLSMITSVTDDSHEFITMIQHEAKRLSTLVDRILRFQVLGRGHGRAEFCPVAPADLVQGVVQEASEKAATKQIEISVELVGQLPTLLVDGEGLALALREIVDNAVKFSPPAQRVQLIVREKIVRRSGPWSAPAPSGGESGAGTGAEQAGERFVVFAVRDRGPGIRPEDRARIFEQFEQLGDLLTAKPDGLGLGLPIAREIARRHGGDLRLRSEPGGGSEFRLYVPVPLQNLEQETMSPAIEGTA